MEAVVIKESNIKGYHYFKRKPHAEIEMKVEKELNNIHDPDAYVVKMTKLKYIHPKYHKEVTRQAKGKDPQQTVSDIAGSIIGRVPANIGKIFHQLFDERKLQRITCRSTDKPTLSNIPPPQESFKRNPGKKDRRGGGGVIPCVYILHCWNSSYEQVHKFCMDSLGELEFQGTECVDELKKRNVVPTQSSTCPW